MDYNEIIKLIEKIDESELALFEIKTDDIYIKMDKSYNRKIESKFNESEEISHHIKNESSEEENSFKKPSIDEKKQSVNEDEVIIGSPMVGTFYASPSPEKEAFVNVGDIVKKGDVLCIIEAMKLMNEVESELEGEIRAILVEDGSMVEYGQPLFKIKR